MNDLDDLFAKILADSAQAALLVDDRIKAKVEMLAMFPLMGHGGRVGKPGRTREILVQKTSYIVIYRVEEAAVYILRVLHAVRDWPESMV